MEVSVTSGGSRLMWRTWRDNEDAEGGRKKTWGHGQETGTNRGIEGKRETNRLLPSTKKKKKKGVPGLGLGVS